MCKKLPSLFPKWLYLFPSPPAKNESCSSSSLRPPQHSVVLVLGASPLVSGVLPWFSFAALLKGDDGCSLVLIGHSRTFFCETCESISFLNVWYNSPVKSPGPRSFLGGEASPPPHGVYRSIMRSGNKLETKQCSGRWHRGVSEPWNVTESSRFDLPSDFGFS